jgi:hypothetical protein
MAWRTRSLLPLILPCVVACGSERGRGPAEDAGVDGEVPDCPPAPAQVASPLRINEVLSDNDGAYVDARGETDDFIELYNAGPSSILLSDYRLRDSSNGSVRLPAHALGPGELLLLWADGETDQGLDHLPFKLSAEGDTLELLTQSCELADRLEIPALPLNESFARFPDGADHTAICRYASPAQVNGKSCEPPPPPELPSNVTFAPYEFPEPWPEAEGPLVITELALKPASFIEVLNTGAATLDLSQYSLRLSAVTPDAAFPDASAGTALPWPASELAPGARMVVPVSADDVAAIAGTEEFEGVATVFEDAGSALDRVDFMRWPSDAVLARFPESSARFAFCADASPDLANKACNSPLPSGKGDRLRALRSPEDFAMLGAGGTDVGQLGVKFVVDLQAGATPAVHFVGSEKWALHYTFVRERIYREPALDRCDPEESRLFHQGWVEFSEREYFEVEGRRFLLGTLVTHANGLHTVEFAAGDAASPEQMRQAFFTAVARTPDPSQWFIRPIDNSQLMRLREAEGSVPIVGPNAPFVDVRYQPLTQTVGFGTLEFVPANELETRDLGPRVIVITDAVPNDVPFVGGLITEAFQTPLAHVNVLSRARGTPNMALRSARKDARLAPLLGKLVRLSVGAADYQVREATAEEADAFWESKKPSGPEVVPPLDKKPRGIIALRGRGLSDLPAVGAKAAQFAELYRIKKPRRGCDATSVPLNVPDAAFAIPFAHYLEHFAASGAQKLLTSLLADPEFRADPAAHLDGLARLREKILEHEVDAALLAQVEAAVRERFGSERVRFRSSSNTEDLPTFNGAGLHTSTSASLLDDELSVANALRLVWASLWNARAFDERSFANISQTGSAMAVLVHGAHRGELSQGVAISRNLMHVTRANTYYINAQVGEATVTNPAPGVVTEQLLYTFPPRSPELETQSRSSLTGGRAVLSLAQARRVACAAGAVHEHFKPLLDPEDKDRLFAMQVEFKFERESGALVVKQARPQPFKGLDVPADCREF